MFDVFKPSNFFNISLSNNLKSLIMSICFIFKKFFKKNLTLEEVHSADEAFFTGTAAEVLPIRSLDGRVIGEGSRGPITEKIQSAYFDQVRGNRSVNEEWHTLVK